MGGDGCRTRAHPRRETRTVGRKPPLQDEAEQTGLNERVVWVLGSVEAR